MNGPRFPSSVMMSTTLHQPLLAFIVSGIELAVVSEISLKAALPRDKIKEQQINKITKYDKRHIDGLEKVIHY